MRDGGMDGHRLSIFSGQSKGTKGANKQLLLVLTILSSRWCNHVLT